MKNLTKLMLVALVAILPLSMMAQKKTQKKKTVPVERYFYISAEGGLSINHTDVADYGFLPKMNDPYLFKNFDGKIGLGYQLGKVLGLTGKFGTAILSGEQNPATGNKAGYEDLVVYGTPIPTPTSSSAFKLDKDVRFEKTKFMEGNLNLTINLINLFFGYNPRRVFNINPHIGVGGIYYQAAEVTKIADGSQIAPEMTKHDLALTVPVGAEINFNLARKLDFFIDYTFTWMNKDNLDQMSKMLYLNGQPNGDYVPITQDMYSSLNAGFRFKFNKKPCDIEGMAARSNEIGMRTNPAQLEEKEGKVCFDVIFTVPAEYFEKEAVMNITPTFTYNGGKLELEPVTFVGEKAEGGDFQVNYKTGGEFTKHYCIDYIPELESAKLVGTPMFYVYKGQIYTTQDDIVKNTYFTQGVNRVITQGVLYTTIVKCEAEAIRTTVKDNVVTVTWRGEADSFDIYVGDTEEPVAKGVKGNSYTFENLEVGSHNIYVRANCGEIVSETWQETPAVAEVVPPREPIAIFYFDYESANLNTVTKMNKTALKALAAKLASGEGITGFEIEGWASPENGDGNNSKLSTDRANAVVNAIKSQMKKVKLNDKDFTFDATGFGSDWETFNALLESSNIADKDQIIRVINNAGSTAKKEQEIQNMKKVYPELEKNILPLIRRAEIYLK